MNGHAIFENVRRYRGIASLYRQTAAFRPSQRWSLLEQASEWEARALSELEAYFAAPAVSLALQARPDSPRMRPDAGQGASVPAKSLRA